MTGTGGSHHFAYVHSDIPEGMSIRAWRAQRAADDIARRASRRRGRLRPLPAWLEALHVRLPRPRRTSREAAR